MWLFFPQIKNGLKNLNLQGSSIEPPKVYDFQKNELTLPLREGRPYILIFWATWCGPCHIELERFHKAIEEKQISKDLVYSISSGEDPQLVQQFISEKKWNLHFFHDTNSELVRRFQVQVTPTLLHISSTHTIEYATSGLSPLAITLAQKHLTPPQ